MSTTFLNLPWFAREHVYYELLLPGTDNTTRLHPVRDKEHFSLRGSKPIPMYSTLCLVSKDVYKEVFVALLKMCYLVINERSDLEDVISKLPPEQLAAVRAINVEIQSTYENDSLSLQKRDFVCRHLSFDQFQTNFPRLRRLIITQTPGSDMFCHQARLKMLADDMDNRTPLVYFSNAWGYGTEFDQLVGDSFAVMGVRAFSWLQRTANQARDAKIRVTFEIRFRCACDPRLIQEECTGVMDIQDSVLRVERGDTHVSVPQVWFLDTTLAKMYRNIFGPSWVPPDTMVL